MTDINLGKLVRGDAPECFVSPLARAAVELVEKSGMQWLLGYSAYWDFGFVLVFNKDLLLENSKRNIEEKCYFLLTAI